MAGRNKRENPEKKTTRRKVRSTVAKKRAENIRRDREQSSLGENIDLFLETAGRTPAPSTIPIERDQAQLRQTGEGGVELPPRFGRTRIVLLTRDPEWIYAWWEVTTEKLDDISRYIGAEDMESARMILRIYDVTGISFDGSNAPDHFDVEIEGKVANWYVHVPVSGRDYLVELGLVTADQRFIRIARSNSTHVPPGRVSTASDANWAVREDDFVRLYQLAGGQGEAPGSGSLAGGPDQLDALTALSMIQGPGSSDILHSAGLGPGMAPGSSEVNYPGGALLPPGSSEVNYPGLAGLAPGASEALYSGVLAGQIPGQEVLFSGSLSSDILSGGAMSSDVLSSSGVGRQGRAGRLPTGRGNEGKSVAPGGSGDAETDDFWLVVRTELVLYGATEPDASVTVKGHPVRLRPDGTFSLRFDLPDGNQDLEVRAVKSNGNHRRRITPRVTKWTEDGRDQSE